MYGEPSSDGKSVVWERLIRTGLGRSEPWSLVGDFNEILNNDEKIGGPKRPVSSFQHFAEMLTLCEMEELKSKGDRFTWGGSRWKKYIRCCLDRCFGNKAWMSRYPDSNQNFLEKRGSDHRPVLVNLKAGAEIKRGQFRFDKRLLHYPEAKTEVINAWRNCGRNGTVVSRIKKCRRVMSLWKRRRRFNAKDKINLLHTRLEWFQSKPYPCRFEIDKIKKELMLAYREEEMYWRQKSREKWLRLGDRNSKFFHFSVKAARVRNYLRKLKDHLGRDQWSDGAKAEVAIQYFSELFATSNPPSYEPVFQSMLPKVTPEMNRTLTGRVTKEEVREAIFSIEAESAPGPDGMSGAFFQKFWSEIGDEVTKEIQEVFETSVLPAEWNFTYICLLPKIPHPENMRDLRPISLCTVLYKTVSKIIVKRLQPLLGDLVSINQSAFVSERMIQDNIIIAHEVVHALRSHPSAEAEFMAVKTDMSKAYDRVEWSYLKALLQAMGFDELLISWVMMCISTASFAVLVNDQPYGSITPTRGIRQGDPLSPLLFVLCTEGLSHLLNVAERNDLLTGIKFTDDGPSIHHLLFADDSLFICRASEEQSSNLMKILKFYGEASGQCINLQKSSITFGGKVQESRRERIQRILGIDNQGGTGRYLGLPECFSGSKVELISYLKDRTQCRLDSWFLRKLSQGGKEILLKTTASALPVYAMSCFKMPKTVIKKLVSLMANYWWSSEPHVRKIHWVSWDRMCLPKSLGGLGFRDLESFNQALLAKQGWRILSQPECLLARFLKSRYFPNDSFLDASIGSKPSYAWRSLNFGKELLKKGLKKVIGNGKSTDVWLDKWVDDPLEGMRAPLRKNVTFDVNLKVDALINGSTRMWDAQKLQENFVPRDVKLIMSKPPAVFREDTFCWKYNKSGSLSVKSAY